jgi:phytoene/squalene synthetase
MNADLAAVAWADPFQRCALPPGLALPLIDGVTQDLGVHMHRDFEGPACYGYGVASTVEWMSMHIIG